MKQKLNTGIARLVLCASLTATLAACGGGGGSNGSGSGTSGSASAPATTSASSMSGTVAIGTALVGAPVTVLDATGKTATATSGSNGTYTVSITGLTSPFAITATDPSGASGNLYSVVASTATSNGAPVTANVTPLTTAVAALLTSNGSPPTLTQSGGLSAVTPSAVTAAVSTLDTALTPILTANGLSASSFDPIGGVFTPNQTGADAVIDSVAVTPSSTGTGMQITSLADPNTAIQLNTGTTVSTTLKNPAQPANYLATLQSEMSQCIAGTSSACSSAIDASYLNDGDSTMQKRHSALFASGTTLTGIKTLAFLPAGTIPNTSGPVALVYFLYTDSSGNPSFASDFVQQASNGWDVIGNQEQYNLYIASFVGRLQYVDQTDATNSRYESGLRFLIPRNVSVSGTTTSVWSALVMGPGLPSGGVYLESGDQVPAETPAPNPYLTFPPTALTAPAITGSTATATGTSSEYKMTWAPISGSSVSVPATSDYPSQQVDLATVQQYGAYTVTLYSGSGAQIGTPQTVINVAPLSNARAGSQVAWQTLGSDVISNFLTPGGSEAGGGVTSVALDWIESATSPLTPGTIWTGEVTPVTNTGIGGGFDYLSSPTITQNGTSYTATISTLTQQALSGATSRSVVLSEQANGDYYINTWQYNN